MSLAVAPNVHALLRGSFSRTPEVSSGAVNRDFQIRFTAVLLALLTVAGAYLAWVNFQKEREVAVPSDGVFWMEHGGALVADRVEPMGPGDKSGIRPGDRLTAVNQHNVTDMAGLTREMYRTGVWSKTTYSVVRNSVPLDAVVILV